MTPPGNGLADGLPARRFGSGHPVGTVSDVEPAGSLAEQPRGQGDKGRGEK